MSDYTPDPYDKTLYEKDQRIRELEAALRGVLDTVLVDGQRYGNSTQRMAQLKAQEALDPQSETDSKHG